MNSNLAIKLREATKKPHTSSENAGFIKCFLKGAIDKKSVEKLTTSLYFVYSALEEEMQRHQDHPVVSAVYFPEIQRRANLEEDLSFFYGEDWRDRISPSPACQQFIARLREISASAPELLIAHAYTRYMGDMSGGQNFKKVARTALNLPGDKGTAFYEFRKLPNLDEFKGKYRQQLNELDINEEMADRIAAEAEKSFTLSRALFKELEPGLIEAIGQEEFDRHAGIRRPGSTELVSSQ
jgi:heme oxygenase